MKYKLRFLPFLIVAFVNIAHGGDITKTPPFIKECSREEYQEALDFGEIKYPCTIGEPPEEKLLPYFERLKQVIRKDDRKFIAEELISYPFAWYQNDANMSLFSVNSSKEFIQHYEAIMTPSVKEYILGIEYETEKCICYIYQGYWSIGNDSLRLNEKGIISVSSYEIGKKKR